MSAQAEYDLVEVELKKIDVLLSQPGLTQSIYDQCHDLYDEFLQWRKEAREDMGVGSVTDWIGLNSVWGTSLDPALVVRGNNLIQRAKVLIEQAKKHSAKPSVQNIQTPTTNLDNVNAVTNPTGQPVEQKKSTLDEVKEGVGLGILVLAAAIFFLKGDE